MPQYASYPLITNPQPEDIVLISQTSTDSLKTVSVDNLADIIGDILNTSIGAPVIATYVLNIPNADLSNAQSLSELANGIVKNTNGTGILSIAVPGTDLVVPGLITSSGLTSVTGVLLGRGTAGTGVIENITVIPSAVQDNITRLGAITVGQWQGSVIQGQYGGTGVANTGKTITLGGSLVTSGAFDLILTLTAATNVTLPTTGTLVTTASPVFTTQITTPKVVWTGSVIDLSGSGTPEGAITAAVGSIYRRTNGSTGTTLYIKETGAGNTGWTAVAGGGASGDVVGPASATDNAIVRFDSTTGKLIQDSNVTLADSGTSLVFSGAAGLTAGGSNQNVTLTPSGTGLVSVSGGANQIIRITSTSTGSARLRLVRPDTASSDLIDLFTTGASDSWSMGIFSSTQIAGGATMGIAYFDGATEFYNLVFNTLGQLSLTSVASQDSYFNIDAVSTSQSSVLGLWQKTAGARSFGNYIYTIATSSDLVVSSRKNNVDSDVIKVLNTDASILMPITTDATTSTAAAVKISGGLAVAKKIKLGSTISTAAPAGATADEWKLGSLVTGLTLSANLTQAIYIDVGGVVYKVLTGT